MKSRVPILLGLAVLIGAYALAWHGHKVASETNDTNGNGQMQMSGPLERPVYGGKLKYLALGDSYTIGESVAAGDRWPMQLAAKLRQESVDMSDPVIIARTGWTTGDLANAMDKANLKEEFDLVTLMIGVNNQFQGKSEEEYRGQFGQLLKRSIDLAKGDVKHVIVLSIPDWTVTPFGAHYDVKRMSAEVDRFNVICREKTAKTAAVYVDVTPMSRQVASQADLVAEDGLHPSGKQYAAWVSLIDLAALKSELVSK